MLNTKKLYFLRLLSSVIANVRISIHFIILTYFVFPFLSLTNSHLECIFMVVESRCRILYFHSRRD